MRRQPQPTASQKAATCANGALPTQVPFEARARCRLALILRFIFVISYVAFDSARSG